ncbi:LacI family DNA-binding transcriptional regulator [Clostridium sp. DJ247]|uniref:LacI family DNA-binding transcriptional regulator n=1 Tax=Clostridium sp. DJ247 TaxID=2726188 RepID=UPI0016291EDD|nr:LacI family DNA-binding transcriptional regulator [Clostridium sp. DJ247]MBC2579517.1 LacI family transcriptional regulator [Clostridium sp. DJ247]
MNVTIHDIAKIAKVSASTVSRVINDNPSISEETKKRIRAIMKELNYTPNSIGKQLAKQSSFTVGFLINTESNDVVLDPFFYDIINGSQSIILPKNFDITICDITYLKPDENILSKFVYSKKADGLIIHVSIINKKIIEQLNELNYPYVIIGKPKENASISWVDADNITAGEIATKHLIEQGYRKIAFIGGTKNEPISSNRIKGYKNILSQLNVKQDTKYIKETVGIKIDGYADMMSLLNLDNPPDSVICINNYAAFGALEALNQKGLNIPKDIGIVTFDDFPLAPYTTPQLTALRIDTFELGKLAGEILMKKIEDSRVKSEIKIVLPQLIIRESSLKNKSQ